MPKPPTPSSYNKLLDDIFKLYENARNSQIIFAWETGRRIVEVEQDGAFRAEYGVGLIQKLSTDLTKAYGQGFSERNLNRMRAFYIAHKIAPPVAELTLSSHVELTRIKDEKVRKGIEKRAISEGLTKHELNRLVTRINSGKGKVTDAVTLPSFPPLKRPTGLKLNTYAKSALNVKLPDGAVLIDCGFFVNRVMTRSELKDVTLTDTPAYTYAATLDRVVDGDTLKVVIDVGFGNRVYDKLRLRGINTPELGTPEGEKAKRYVAGLLPPGSLVVLKSHKSGIDKYGRFVVDIFFRRDGACPVSTAEEIISDGTYLNQHLIDAGLAKRMEG